MYEQEYEYFARCVRGEEKTDQMIQNFKMHDGKMPTKEELITTFRLVNEGMQGNFVKMLRHARTNPNTPIDLRDYDIGESEAEGQAYAWIVFETDDFKFQAFYDFIKKTDASTSVKNIVRGLAKHGLTFLAYVGETMYTMLKRAWGKGGHFKHGSENSGGSYNCFLSAYKVSSLSPSN